MTTISNTNKEQTGGYFNLQIFTLDELTTCPDVLTNANAKNVVFTPLVESLDVLPVQESIKISCTPRTNKSGTYYNIKASVEFDVQTSEIDTFLNNIRIKRHVVVIGVKHFGQQKMYGSKIFPLIFSYQEVNGTKYQDGQMFQINVAGKIPQKPVFIND